MATQKPKWTAPENVKRSEDMTGIWPTYNEPSTFPWSEVNGGLLLAALHVCTVKGVTLAFGTAMGGRGIVLTLYMGQKVNPKRFALGAEELHQLLYALIQQWGSTSEDLGEVFGYDTSPGLAAD